MHKSIFMHSLHNGTTTKKLCNRRPLIFFLFTTSSSLLLLLLLFYFHYANFQFYIFYPLILNFKSLPDSTLCIHYKQQKQEFKNLTRPFFFPFFFSLYFFTIFFSFFSISSLSLFLFFNIFLTFQVRACMSSLNKVKSFSSCFMKISF